MDKPFKKFEREVASLIGGARFPANSGAELDCEGPTIVAQAKLVKRLSLEELSQLAETAAAQGQARGKIGVVGVKIRRGAGHPSPGLVVMTFEQFTAMQNATKILNLLIDERDRVLDVLLCKEHGRCVPHALDEIARLQSGDVTQCVRHPDHKLVWCNACIREERGLPPEVKPRLPGDGFSIFP